MEILSLCHVSYSYQSRYLTVHAVQDVSCSFETGKFYALTGPSGSGKTTLLSLLAGLDLPTQGEVLFSGSSTAQIDRDRYRRESVSVVYQAFNLFQPLTALENVQYPMQLRHLPRAETKETAKKLLARVGLPPKIEKQYPAMMSGGEQQRVAVARALAAGGRVLLADEPTGNLDSANSENIIAILRALAHEEGLCVIVVTHDPHIAEQADHVYLMRDGKLTAE